MVTVMSRLTRWVTVLVPGAFLALFFIYPVVSVLGRGLGRDGLDAFGDLASSGRIRDTIWFTVWQAVVSTAITVAVALPAAGIVARLSGRRQRLVRALVTVPFVLPTVVVAGAFEGLFDRFGLDSGAIRLRHTVWAVLLAHVFFNYAVIVRAVGSYWSGLDGRLEDQARILGASRWQTFREITLPRLRPALLASSAIVFLFSFTSFGVVLILGGPRRATIETEIYRFAVTRSDLSSAAAMAVVQLVAVLALIMVTTRLERRRPVTVVQPQRASLAVTRRWLGANVLVAMLLLGAPIGTLIERSVSVGDRYGLDNYRALGERVQQLPAPATTALWNSLVFAVVATSIASVVGMLASVVVLHGTRWLRHIFDLGLTLPLGTSAVTIGFGILIALDEPPLDLRTSWWIVPIAHALVGTPFVVRSVVPALRAIDPSLREAAAVLGAAPGRVRREIDVPIGMRGLVVGAGFAFAVSLGEFGAPSFIPRRADLLTAPVALFRLLGTPGEQLRGQAMALAVIIMVMVATAVLLIESARSSNDGSI